MAYDPSIFNINPYYDDFDTEKGFLRILFKPGYALQARELTQAQSILQNQLSRVGDHLFKDGSRIVGGGISVRNTNYVMVKTGVGTAFEGITDFSPYLGTTITDGSAVAKIVHYIAPDEPDQALILVVDFLVGSSLSTTQTYTISSGDTTLTTGVEISTGFTASGTCKLVSVTDGIFYVDGFFVQVSAQNFAPYFTGTDKRDLSFNSFTTLSKKIGFVVTRDSVTEQEDSTLRDPAIGSYNYNAPGADRYKIILSLGQYDLDEVPNDFVELLRFENGKITKKIDRIAYGDIEKALAIRTYDESGSYTINSFDLSVKPNTDTSLFMKAGAGKAYVLGKEVENVYSQNVSFLKARTTQTEDERLFSFSIGNYIGANVDTTGYSSVFTSNFSQIASGSATLKFIDGSGNAVASAYVHGAVPEPTTTSGPGLVGTTYRLYLYGVSGAISGASSGFMYLNNGTTAASILPLDSVFAWESSDSSSLVFDLQPGYAVKSVDGLKIVGKISGDSQTPVQVSYNSGTQVTTYTINRNHFINTISASSTQLFRFLPYGFSNNNTSDISEISFVQNLGTSEAFVPLTGRVTSSNNDTQIVLTVSGAPSPFANNNSLIATVPILYSPNPSDPTTFRTKTSTAATVSIPSVTSIRTDENGRKYYVLPNIDVYSVSNVTFSAGTPSVTTDITEDFELDDGQKDSYYDNSRLYVKESKSSLARYNSESPSDGVNLSVSYLYFQHGGLKQAPFIGALSYTNIAYDKIPLYTDPKTGKTVSLANCLDFRRSGLTATDRIVKPYGRSEFGIIGDTSVTYTHYLPRIDKFCVKSDPFDGSALFYFVRGTPDLSPVAPPDPSDGLVLATVTVPAYTHNPTDVVITPVESRRFTMSDIGKIQKRVDEIEVFTKLSISESEIENKSLRSDLSQTEPLKTSILSDEFYGHSVADVSDKNYSCSVDFERGELRPYFDSLNVTLPTAAYDGTTVSSDGLLTLNYSTVSYIDNNQYTKTVKINPSNTVNWLGFMKLSSQVDPFYDTAYRPVVKTNALMENDNWISANTQNRRGFGTQWNEWESIWTGIEDIQEEQDDVQRRIIEMPHSSSDSAVPSHNSGNVRLGISRTVGALPLDKSNFIRARQLKNRIKYRIGSRVVDRSVVPFVPSKTITATVYGLKPNISQANGLQLYFDGELVRTGITTDSNGSAVVSFGISAGTYLAGSKTVRITDSEDITNSTVSADVVYHCTGVLEQALSGVYSTRPPELRRLITSSEAISKDPFNRDIDSVTNTHCSDPLSQTFFVDKKTNPEGIFISSLDLFFSSKDSTLPVTVQIRPTVGGYPSPSVVVPFSTVTLLPEQVNAGSSPTPTTFAFSSPVYLQPGEYAICILANSDDYEVFAAQSSVNTIANDSAVAGRAGNNQLVGTLFTPQGIGPAVSENATDLMFSLQRCEFGNIGSANWSGVENCINSQILKFYAPEIIPDGCSIVRKINSSIEFANNDSVYIKNSLLTENPQISYTFNRGVLTTVTPMVDLQAMYGASVQMYGNASVATPTSIYVSRVVDLPGDLASNGIAVFLEANLPNSNVPTGSNVKVYFRGSEVGEADIFNTPWTDISSSQITPGFVSASEIDYRQVEYRYTTATDFKTYQVRVDLVSGSNPVYENTPSVRSIRMVSFQTVE